MDAVAAAAAEVVAEPAAATFPSLPQITLTATSRGNVLLPAAAVVDALVDGTIGLALRMEVVAWLTVVLARHRRNWTRKWRITGVERMTLVLSLLRPSLVRRLCSLSRSRLLLRLAQQTTILI